MADRYSDEALERREPSEREPSRSEQSVVKEVRARVAASYAARKKFINERRVCRAFMESQWSAADIRNRARADEPTIQIHLIQQRVQEVMHDFRMAGVGFRVGSATSETGKDAAKAFNGLALRDQRESLAESVLERIVDEAVTYGEAWGQWLDVSEHEMSPVEGDVSPEAVELSMFDRRLVLREPDQDALYPDPTDTTPDRHDMGWFVEVRQVSWEERDAEFPRAARLAATSWDDFGPPDAGFWFLRTTGETAMRDRQLRLAYYYRRRYETVSYLFVTGWDRAYREDRVSVKQQAEFEAAGAKAMIEKKRVPIIEHFVTDGRYVLAGPTRVQSGVIPYFRAYGQDLKTTDGQVIPRGLAWLLKDANSLLSVTLSELAYKESVAGQNTWIGPAESIRGHEAMWSDATVKHPIRLYNAYSRTPGPNQERVPLEMPQHVSIVSNSESALATAGVARELLGSVAGSADPQQRDVTAQHRSAAALSKMDEMAATNRSSFIWSVEKSTMKRMGEIWLSMARVVYDRRGRHVMIAADEDSDVDEGYLIGEPFVRDPKSGAPIPLYEIAPMLPEDVGEVPAELFDPALEGRTLKVLRFSPATDVVKVTTFAANLAKASKDAKAEFLLQVMQSMPDLAPAAVVPMLRAASDIVPLDDVVENAEKLFPDPVGDSTDVGAMAGQLAAAQQQIQQLQAQMQELQTAADQGQAARDIAALKADTDKEVAGLVEQFKLAIAQLKAATDLQKVQMQGEQKLAEKGMDAAVREADRDASTSIEGAKMALAASQPKGKSDGGSG